MQVYRDNIHLQIVTPNKQCLLNTMSHAYASKDTMAMLTVARLSSCVGLEASAALQQLLVRWAELTVFNCIAHNQLCLEFRVQLNLSPSRVDSSIDCYTVVNRLTPKQPMLMSQPQSNHMQADDG